MKWDSFLSTTKKKDVAMKFGNVLFEMYTSNFDPKGINVSSVSLYPDEDEVLLPPQIFRVTFHY